MPLCPRPGATYDFVLKVDESKPEAERPVFKCRFQTSEQWHATYAKVEAASNIPDDQGEKCFAELLEVFKNAVASTLHMEGYESLEQVFKYMTDRERWDFAWNHLWRQRATEDEWGKLRSQRASEPAPSAKNAPAPASA